MVEKGLSITGAFVAPSASKAVRASPSCSFHSLYRFHHPCKELHRYPKTQATQRTMLPSVGECVYHSRAACMCLCHGLAHGNQRIPGFWNKSGKNNRKNIADGQSTERCQNLYALPVCTEKGRYLKESEFHG